MPARSPFRHLVEKPVEGRIAFEDDPPKKGQGRFPPEPNEDVCTVACEPVHVYQIPHVVGDEVVWLPWRVEAPVSKAVLEDGSVSVEDAKGIRHVIPSVHVLTVYPA